MKQAITMFIALILFTAESWKALIAAKKKFGSKKSWKVIKKSR